VGLRFCLFFFPSASIADRVFIHVQQAYFSRKTVSVAVSKVWGKKWREISKSDNKKMNAKS
jgi:formylmethanofuran dehydrogenase subunit E-like metal-binding protein